MKNYLMAIGIVSCVAIAGCTAGYVTERPRDVTYVRPVSPGPGYVWVSGEWEYTGSGYHWKEGTWQKAREGRTWKPGYWESNQKGYKWHKGSWHER